jgi:hypothetical protein
MAMTDTGITIVGVEEVLENLVRKIDDLAPTAAAAEDFRVPAYREFLRILKRRDAFEIFVEDGVLAVRLSPHVYDRLASAAKRFHGISCH